MQQSKRRIARVLFAAGVLVPSLIGTAAISAGADPKAKGDIVSDDGDSVKLDSAEASALGDSPSKGTGVASADTSASAEDLVPATPAGGGSEAESVIFPDKRTKITTTTAYPARATAHITFSKAGVSGTFGCTGFFVGPDTLATAGHCVHRGTGGTAGFHVRSSFRIYPGRNGSTIPYKCPGGTVVLAKKLWSNTSWTNGGGETVDYGAIETNCAIGNTVGWYGYINTNGVSQTNQPDYTQGYPGDKPFGTQWAANNCSSTTTFVQCRITVTQTRQLFYKNDTAGGQSGSPVYRKASTCNPCAIAIHAYGLHGSAPHSSNNHGTRIENNVTSFLNFVKSQA